MKLLFIIFLLFGGGCTIYFLLYYFFFHIFNMLFCFVRIPEKVSAALATLIAVLLSALVIYIGYLIISPLYY